MNFYKLIQQELAINSAGLICKSSLSGRGRAEAGPYGICECDEPDKIPIAIFISLLYTNTYNISYKKGLVL